jgi:hypothetical protein
MRNSDTASRNSDTPSVEWAQPGHTRSDARLIERAARSGWAVPDGVKQRIIDRLSECIADADARSLTRIAAAFVSMDNSDTAAGRLALDRERGSQSNDLVFRIVRDETP